MKILCFIFFALLTFNQIFASTTKPISSNTLQKVRESSLLSNIPHCLEIEKNLVEISVSYYGVDNKVHTNGLIIVHKSVAKYVVKIFNDLQKANFNIFGIDPFKGFVIQNKEVIVDDDYNYTGSYSCRLMVGGSSPSRHSLGMAIDINPLFNPFLQVNIQTKVIENIVPKNGIFYLNRDPVRPNKPDRFGVITKDIVNIFAQNGFTTWGGYWDFPLDYHHFELSSNLAQLLLAMKDNDGEKMFEVHVRYYNKKHTEIVLALMEHFELKEVKDLIEIYKQNPSNFFNIISNNIARF